MKVGYISKIGGACENDTDPDTGLCDDEECIYCKMAKASVPVFKEMDRG